MSNKRRNDKYLGAEQLSFVHCEKHGDVEEELIINYFVINKKINIFLTPTMAITPNTPPTRREVRSAGIIEKRRLVEILQDIRLNNRERI